MEVNFTNTPPDWEAEGKEPEKEMKQSGFQAGYKPPAQYFNWFWTKASKCLKELQTLVKTAVGELTQSITKEETARESGDTALRGELAQYIRKDNAEAYTPEGDYNPATKKYVDDAGVKYEVLNIREYYSDCAALLASNAFDDLHPDVMDPGGDFDKWRRKIYLVHWNDSSSDQFNGVLELYHHHYMDGGEFYVYAQEFTDYHSGRIYRRTCDIYYEGTPVPDAYGKIQWRAWGDVTPLTSGNTKAYTPTGDYNPATKKYVDDAVDAAAPKTLVFGSEIDGGQPSDTLAFLNSGVFDEIPEKTDFYIILSGWETYSVTWWDGSAGFTNIHCGKLEVYPLSYAGASNLWKLGQRFTTQDGKVYSRETPEAFMPSVEEIPWGDWTSADALVQVAPEMHRMIFRGKNLGDTFTEAQKAAVKDGSFADLYVGDYWKIDDVTYRIADMDYWYGCGENTKVTEHHLLLIPDGALDTAAMDSGGNTDNGYGGSTLRTSGLQTAEEKVKAAFGEGSILTHESFFVNQVTDGRPAASAVYQTTLEIPDERMVYGNKILGAVQNSGNPAAENTYAKTQLALFMIAPKYILARDGGGVSKWWWLRDVYNAQCFVTVSSNGQTAGGAADGAGWIRPVFAVVGTRE